MLAALLLATIHSVDFQNFAYRIGRQRVVVHGGTGKVLDPMDPTVFTRIDAIDVAYGDLMDGRGDEAAVTIHLDQGGTGSFSFVNIYAMRGDKAVRVARFDGGDRAHGGIRAVRIDRRLLVITQNHSSSCQACIDAIIESRYRWNGTRFVLVRRSSSPPSPP